MTASDADGGPDDRALWRGLACADPEALTQLYLRHCDAVYNFAFRRTASWAAAEDVVQATFTAVWRRARAGDVDELRADTARAVLLVMAGQECANVARSARRQRLLRGRIEADAGSAAAPDHAGSVAANVDDERRMSDVRRAVARLPPVQRDVLELVVWSRCSMGEAAAALGVSEGTVKSRLHRARRSLASDIRIDPHEEPLS